MDIVVRECFQSEDDKYVGRVAALLKITCLSHPQSVLVRRCWAEGYSVRKAARRLWEHSHPYRCDIPF